MPTNRATAAFLVLATIALAVVGEALVLTHTAGALGLILLACSVAAGIAARVAFGAPRTRSDIHA